ncbi:cytidylyltransferase domain-containing protein [Chloroflexota bacterium]
MGAGLHTVGIVIARMGSDRFPGKMMAGLCGVPLLEFVVRRARRIHGLDELTLATTEQPVDDELAQIARRLGLGCYRGSSIDVAGRVLGCARQAGADYFLRLNGDSPCIDAELVGEGLRYLPEGYDLITNIPGRTFPYGISLELVRTDALAGVYPRMTAREREHVTGYFYGHTERCIIKNIINPDNLEYDMKFTVDTPEDLARLAGFFKNKPNRSWREV